MPIQFERLRVTPERAYLISSSAEKTPGWRMRGRPRCLGPGRDGILGGCPPVWDFSHFWLLIWFSQGSVSTQCGFPGVGRTPFSSAQEVLPMSSASPIPSSPKPSSGCPRLSTKAQTHVLSHLPDFAFTCLLLFPAWWMSTNSRKFLGSCLTGLLAASLPPTLLPQVE